MNKPLIIQQGTGPYESLMRYGEDLARAYAARIGCDYQPCAFTVGPHWTTEEKFRLPLSIMTGSGRLLLSGDADLLFVGTESWMEALGDADFAAVRNQGKEFNVGVMIIRDTPKMIAVLSRALHRLPMTIRNTGTQYCDQMLLNNELELSRVQCKELNRKWNEYSRSSGKLDGAVQIKSFHDLGNTFGPKPARKLELMKHWRANYATAV